MTSGEARVEQPGDPASRTLFAALDAMPSAMVAVSADGTINYVNRQAVRTFGYAADELLGRPAAMLIPDADVGDGQQLTARRKDGSTFPVEVSLTPLPTDVGAWTLAGVVDITARRAAEDKVRGLSRARLALAELNAEVLLVESSRELYDATCRAVAKGSPHTAAWVALPNACGELVVATRAGDAGPLDDVTLLSDLPGLADALGDQARWICGDVAAGTSGPWREWALSQGIAAVISLPLRCDGKPVALVAVTSTRRELLDDEFVALLETMADNVSIALDRHTARERMLAIDSQRVELLGRLVAAQEEERGRIADDVHDHSVQALAALDLRLGLHRTQVLQLAPELVDSVDVLIAGLIEVTDGLRHLLFDLEAADSDVSLVDQLTDALDHVFEDADLVHTLEVVPGSGARSGTEYADLVPDIRGQAVRIFKEALANVRRHAEASTVRVTVTPDEQGVEVMVADDGVGPTADVAGLRSGPGHRGLDGMRDRAEVAGGWCRIERADHLTVLRFWLPRTHADAPRT